MRFARHVAVCAVLLFALPTRALAQSTLYDDFSGPQIDPAKWSADQPLSGSGAGLEMIRQISDAGLVLQHRVLGGQISRVDFQKDDDPVQSIAYVLNDASPPSVPFAALEVAGFVGKCTDPTRTVGDMTAQFGSVFVNP